jgi:glycosyltransferase involved in cell wall biosynthesis
MNNSPLVTIVTPSFNQGRVIEKTIKSVLNQTYKNIEYIIVDGGSNDNTMNIINSIGNIDIIINEKDTGQTNAINKGFKLAKGELVGWINSDDMLYPECVEKIVELYIEKPDGAIYYNCNIDNINENDEKINSYKRIVPNRKYLLKSKYDIIQPGSFYKKNIIERVNYLNEELNYCMDLDLWLRLSDLASIYYLDIPSTSAFRKWNQSKTSRNIFEFIVEIRKVLIKNGASNLSYSVLQTYYYSFQIFLKKFINKK